jgi:hypothetical protein
VGFPGRGLRWFQEGGLGGFPREAGVGGSRKGVNKGIRKGGGGVVSRRGVRGFVEGG